MLFDAGDSVVRVFGVGFRVFSFSRVGLRASGPGLGFSFSTPVLGQTMSAVGCWVPGSSCGCTKSNRNVIEERSSIDPKP